MRLNWAVMQTWIVDSLVTKASLVSQLEYLFTAGVLAREDLFLCIHVCAPASKGGCGGHGVSTLLETES